VSSEGDAVGSSAEESLAPCHASRQWTTPEPRKCPRRVEEPVISHAAILPSSSAVEKVFFTQGVCFQTE